MIKKQDYCTNSAPSQYFRISGFYNSSLNRLIDLPVSFKSILLNSFKFIFILENNYNNFSFRRLKSFTPFLC